MFSRSRRLEVQIKALAGLLYSEASLVFYLCLHTVFSLCASVSYSLFFFGRTHSMGMVLDQGRKLCHSSNPSHCSDNSRPLTPLAGRELPEGSLKVLNAHKERWDLPNKPLALAVKGSLRPEGCPQI